MTMRMSIGPNSVARHAAIANDYRPRSIADCYGSQGELDLMKFLQHQEKCSDLSRAERNVLLDGLMSQDDTAASTSSSRRTRKRNVKALTPYYFDDGGNVVYLKPMETAWWHLHVQSPLVEDKKFTKKFRRRFRMTCEQYQTLLVKVKRSSLFERWVDSKDATGRRSSPIQLMCLGAMRYLGRGLTFDDLEEHTAINEETHRQFLHAFITWGSTVFFEEQVHAVDTK